jgi:hypothetical protein
MLPIFIDDNLSRNANIFISYVYERGKSVNEKVDAIIDGCLPAGRLSVLVGNRAAGYG